MRRGISQQHVHLAALCVHIQRPQLREVRGERRDDHRGGATFTWDAHDIDSALALHADVYIVVATERAECEGARVDAHDPYIRRTGWIDPPNLSAATGATGARRATPREQLAGRAEDALVAKVDRRAVLSEH